MRTKCKHYWVWHHKGKRKCEICKKVEAMPLPDWASVCERCEAKPKSGHTKDCARGGATGYNFCFLPPKKKMENKPKGKLRIAWWRDGCIWSIDMRECRLVCDHYYTRDTSARRAARQAAKKMNIELEG